MIAQWLLKVGSDLFLTDTGINTGVPYLSEININETNFEFRKVNRIDMKGNLYNEMTEVGQKGKVITIKTLGLLTAHYTTLRTILRDFDSSGTPVGLSINHPANDGNYNFQFDCSFDYLRHDGHLTGQFRNVEMQFTTFGESD